MSQQITNLTVPLIAEEIENVLTYYHYHPYQQAFAIPELRQLLVTYVLNCVPACYAMVEPVDTVHPDSEVVPRHLREQLKSAVTEGIEHIIEENADWVSHHIPHETNPSQTPSTWFG